MRFPRIAFITVRKVKAEIEATIAKRKISRRTSVYLKSEGVNPRFHVAEALARFNGIPKMVTPPRVLLKTVPAQRALIDSVPNMEALQLLEMNDQMCTHLKPVWLTS